LLLSYAKLESCFITLLVDRQKDFILYNLKVVYQTEWGSIVVKVLHY